MTERSRFWATVCRGLVPVVVFAALLAGCSSGKDGAPGATGATGGTGPTGPSGPPGPVTALDVSTASTITVAITSVTGGATPTVNFQLADQNGYPLKGLPDSALAFAVAQLQPAPAAGTPGEGTSTQWVSYVTEVNAPSTSTALKAWGTGQHVQPSTEGGAGAAAATPTRFVDHGDGTYSYTFSQGLDAYATTATANYSANPLPDGSTPTVAYDGTLTHRMGIEIRGTGLNPTNNGLCDYVPSSSTGTCQTSGLPTTRYIVGNAECNACHQKFALHGGPRIDVPYCVLCHNTYNYDPSSDNSLDFKVLVHKVHMGTSLPSVVAAGVTGVSAPTKGVGYVVWGYQGRSSYNYNQVLWPQDQRNCQTCHNTSDPATPDAGNYKNVPYSAACTTCHDNVNTTTGAGHSSSNMPVTDAQCIGCHGPAGNAGPLLTVDGAHTIQQNVNAANYQFKLTGLAPVIPDPVNNVAGDPTGPMVPDPAVSCPQPTTAICQVPAGDYVSATVLVTDASGKPLSLGAWTPPAVAGNPGVPTPNSASLGFDVTNFIAPPNPFSATNPQGPSLTVEIGLTTANYTNPGGTSATIPTAIGIRFLGYSVVGGVWGYSNWSGPAGARTAWYGQPPAQNADGSYTRNSLRKVPAGLVGIAGNVSGAAFIEGRAITSIAPATAPPSYWLTPVQSAGPYPFPISGSKAAARRVVVDIKNCDKCHFKLSWHTQARNNPTNGELCTTCHNPEAVASNATSAGPLDFKFFIHGIHSAQYRYGGLDFTSCGIATGSSVTCTQTSTIPTPTSFMNRKDDAYPIYFPWVANPANAAANAGANCEACHVTGGSSYYPVDPTQVFATSIAAGPYQTPSATVPPGTPGTTPAVGPQDDIAITPNVAACGSCHTSQTDQSHMQQNGGITAAWQAAQNNGQGTPIKAANGSTLVQYQTEACAVCHGPGAISDVKLAHKIASFY